MGVVVLGVVTGNRGTGKSTWAAKLLLSEAKKDKRRAFTNLDVSDAMREAWGGRLVEGSLQDSEHFWELVPPGSVSVIDEAGVVFNARATGSQNKQGRGGLFEFLSHSRKTGDDVWFLTQQFSRVDLQIRLMADVIVQINSTMRLEMLGWWPGWCRFCFGHLLWSRWFDGADETVCTHSELFDPVPFFEYFDSWSTALSNLRRGIADVEAS